MQYLLLLHMDEGGWSRLSPSEQSQRLIEYGAYTGALRDSGKLVVSSRLAPSEGARTIQTKGGRPVVMDGPFAETKEQLAGFYLIDVADLAEAEEWAGRCPAAAHGVVEVRQLFTPPA